MRSLIRLLLVVAALAYGAMPFAGMATVAPAESLRSMPAPAMQHGQHGQHGDGMAAQPGQTAAIAAATSEADCPQHTKADAKGHCAACLSLPAFQRLDDPKPFAEYVPCPALSARLVSRIAAPLVPPPRA